MRTRRHCSWNWSPFCCRRSVDQFVCVTCSLWAPWSDFTFFFLSFDNYFLVLLVGRPLWREDGPVVYSAIAPGQVSDDQ
jgi:hypothetical protein